MAHNIINSNDVKNICSQIQLSNLIEKNFIKPLVTIYISNIFTNGIDAKKYAKLS